MTAHFLDKKEIASSESTHHSISGITKKIWQTPKLLDMNYSETNGGTHTADDGVTQDADPLS
jgi:hypothetical protein